MLPGTLKFARQVGRRKIEYCNFPDPSRNKEAAPP